MSEHLSSKTNKSNSQLKDTNLGNIEKNVNEHDNISELLVKSSKLKIQNDDLKKEIQELTHNKNQRIKQLTMEKENLTKTLKSLEELVNTLKKGKDAQSKLETKKLISDLESKVVYLEQSEQNLKRKNQQLNIEISNLRLEIEKNNFQKQQNPEENQIPPRICTTVTSPDFTMDDVTLDEAKKIIKELMSENDELRIDKSDMEDKALNLLTEKELTNVTLREDLDQIKLKLKNDRQLYEIERQDLQTQIELLKSSRRMLNKKDKNYSDNIDNSERISDLEVEILNIKKEYDLKEQQWNREREKLTRGIEEFEYNSKNKIQSLEVELSKLKLEVGNHENDKIQLTKELNQNSRSKNMLHNELENYIELIKLLEEQKENLDSQCKERIRILKKELEDYEAKVETLSNEKNYCERELAKYKESGKKQMNELIEKHKSEIENKDSIISTLKKKYETIDRDSEFYRIEYESLRRSEEKRKFELIDMTDNLKQIRENYEQEIKKCESNLLMAEKTFEKEKNSLTEKLGKYKGIIGKMKRVGGDNNTKIEEQQNEVLDTFYNVLETVEEFEEQNVKETNPVRAKKKNSLSNVMDSANDYNLESINLSLQNDNQALTNQVNELKLKLNQVGKQIFSVDLLKKENQKLKSDTKEVESMYEEQIKDLQEKLIQSNLELQMQKRRLTNPESYLYQEKGLDIIEGEQEANIKFLTEKINILNSEIIKLKELRENDVKFLQEQAKSAEQMAAEAKLELANFYLEKDIEILKYKTTAKKLSQKINNYQKKSSIITLDSPSKKKSLK